MNINVQLINSVGAKATPVPPPPEEAFAAPRVTPAPAVKKVEPEEEVMVEEVQEIIADEPEQKEEVDSEQVTEDNSAPAIEAPVEQHIEEVTEKVIPVVEKVEQTVFIPSCGSPVVAQRFGDTNRSSSSIKRPPQNSGLKSFISMFKEDTKISLEQMIVFSGESVRRSTFPGVWEEGGATYGQEGSVLLVTDHTGGRKSASMAYHDKKFANGKHALIRVEEGDLLIVGYRMEDFEIIAVYQIVGPHIKPAETRLNKDGTKYTPPNKWDIDGKLAGAFVQVNDVLTWEAGDREFDVEFTTDSPCIAAAINRLHEQFTHAPCYIKSYNPLPFDDNEWNKIVADREFMQSTKLYDNLDSIYAATAEVAKDKLFEITKEESINTIIILDINTNKPGVWVCVYVTIYDHRKRTSVGKRLFAGCTFIDEKDNFFYDGDKDTVIPCSQIIEAIKRNPIDPKTGNRRYSGSMLKRVTL